MNILGISAFYHDSAAALVQDGKIVAAAQEERFSRIKNDKDFPLMSVKYCLAEAGLQIDELDAVAFYDKPFLKFERLLETYYSFAPRGIRSFLTAMPSWIKEKIFIKKVLRSELKKVGSYNSHRLKLLFPEHHLSHAASSYFASNFSESAILTIDGVGEWATATISKGTENRIELLKELHFPHSVGLFYSAFTYFLGFTVNSDEYKLMGLAPYGNPDSIQTKKFRDLILTHLISIAKDGSIQMNQQYFTYAYGLKMVSDDKFQQLFGFTKRKPGEEFEQHHLDLALAVQLITEEIVIKLATHTKELTNCNKLCLAGGVALNCVANGKIEQSRLFDEIFIQPAAGDAGGALGAALAGYHIYFANENRPALGFMDKLQGAFLGPAFSENEVEAITRQHSPAAKKYNSPEALCEKTAELIALGYVVGWFQGRMEFGPRALGNRSILADPRNEEMQKKLNLKIKFRESFRPFAPAVLEEDASQFFENVTISPYMLMVHPVKNSLCNAMPDNYHQLPLFEKLYTVRSSIPAVTHVDFSARIQTVSHFTNPLFHLLLQSFKKITGIGLLINTSFNVKDEPIVCSPGDAYACFLKTGMDFLVIGNYILSKGENRHPL
jgi:carbamoyltransferase